VSPSFKGEGDDKVKRGVALLKNSPIPDDETSMKSNKRKELKRGRAIVILLRINT
jgi:hypothetical protein